MRRLPSALFYKTFFPRELQSRVTEKHTKVITHAKVYAPQSIARTQVLVTVERNGYVTEVFPEAAFTHKQ